MIRGIFYQIALDVVKLSPYIGCRLAKAKGESEMMRNPNKSREGFTLMEIMVVIIVIAVLASVAGPMIGSITDQGKAAATRASMQNLKTALVNYNNDLGKFPFSGTDANNVKLGTAYNLAATTCLADEADANVLVADGNSTYNLGIANATYLKRWKGPYMDSDPLEYMYDAWEGRIVYLYYNKALYLHSFGPDSAPEDIAEAVNSGNDNHDDITMSVSRLKNVK